jgi:hypothetical protein
VAGAPICDHRPASYPGIRSSTGLVAPVAAELGLHGRARLKRHREGRPAIDPPIVLIGVNISLNLLPPQVFRLPTGSLAGRRRPTVVVAVWVSSTGAGAQTGTLRTAISRPGRDPSPSP